ncbi:MAG: glycosyl hydrolase family 95 catalytic domain-containing protein [Planctomycetota bacterium]|jgi:hypothetical protein
MKNYLFQSVITTKVMVLFILLSFQVAIYAHSIPHAEALNSAAVIQSSIDNVNSKAMIIGNGDINALIFSRNNQIIMHLSKNDVWDARLITENDPPLLKVDISNHSWSGGSQPPSWSHPYPTPTPACVIKIDYSGNITNTNLDLKRGLATITTSSETIMIRALMHMNAIAIEAGGAVSIEGFYQKFLPVADKRQSGNQQVVKQTIPGDIDVPGMDVYIVKISNSNLHAVSVAHTKEAKLAEDTATASASKVIGTPLSTTIQLHEGVWFDFWSKSGVQLADQDLQNWWYRQLYYLRCLSKPDGFPIALQGGYNNKPGWHGSWTMNYNAEQTFWPSFSSNHPDLAMPFINLVEHYHPRAKWVAKTVFNSEGASSPHNHYPFEPDPAKSKSKNNRHFSYMPWSYGIGTSGHMMSILWAYYDYTRDPAYLKNKLFPLLKDYATFYAHFIEQCRENKGVVAFGPSVDQEHGGFGRDNSPYDLAWAKSTLNHAIESAEILDTDPSLRTRWSNALAKLPYYPISGDKGNDYVQTPGVGGYNIVTPVVPVFPAELISWFSSTDEKELFKRTIKWIETRYNKNNSVVMLNVARARFSMTDDAINDTKTFFKEQEQANGLFHWQGHGYYMSEQTAVAGLINEFLLQSVHGIIRIFPAWPKDKDATFTHLRAQGGFLVTAEQKSGEVYRLEIVATVPGTLRVVSPWPTIKVKYGVKEHMLKPDAQGVVTLEAEIGAPLEFFQ